MEEASNILSHLPWREHNLHDMSSASDFFLVDGDSLLLTLTDHRLLNWSGSCAHFLQLTFLIERQLYRHCSIMACTSGLSSSRRTNFASLARSVAATLPPSLSSCIAHLSFNISSRRAPRYKSNSLATGMPKSGKTSCPSIALHFSSSMVATWNATLSSHLD